METGKRVVLKMKGVIVVDIPKCCDLCRFSSQAYDSDLFEEGECYCTIKIKSVDSISEGNKPEWCPIKSVPEKMEEKENTVSIPGVFMEGKVSGWNDCIDKILERQHC